MVKNKKPEIIIKISGQSRGKIEVKKSTHPVKIEKR